MSGDFGVFDDELREVPIEMGADRELHTTDDIETVLDTMRHLPAIELQQIRENLLKSIPATNSDDSGGIDWTSREMLILNSLTVVAFIAFGKHFTWPTIRQYCWMGIFGCFLLFSGVIVLCADFELLFGLYLCSATKI